MAYPVVITIRGEPVTLMGHYDIVDLIAERLPGELKDCITDLIELGQRTIEEAKSEIDSDLTSYESTIEENRDTFQTLNELLDVIEIELERPRTRKSLLRYAVSQMREKTNDQI